MEPIPLCQQDGLVEVPCREVILVENNPALVVNLLLLSVSITDAYRLVDKRTVFIA